jgi:magnesium-protoporphyrin O-methyltransferase
MAMHTVGKVFPKGNRSPAIVPVSQKTLHRLIETDPALKGWTPGRSARVDSGFYLSSAQEVVRP